jgi:predicted CoA-binding protein
MVTAATGRMEAEELRPVAAGRPGSIAIACRNTGLAAKDNGAMKTVAVVGASNNRSKFGNKAVRAFLAEGHRVIPVNPNEREVEGVRAYASVLDVPDPIDMATVYVQPEVAYRLLDEFERKGIEEIWVNPGAESEELLAEARRRKLNVIAACSIVGIGRSPSEF